MDKVTILGPEHFHLQPDAPEVFGWMGCGKNMPCRAAFDAAWPEAAALLQRNMLPRAALSEHEELLTVFLTLGAGPENRVDSLFAEHKYVLASLLNTLCDQMLFQMNHQFSDLLQRRLNAEHHYMAERQEPGVDFSPDIQRKRFAPLQSAFPEVKISSSGILTPAKSMMYCVTLTQQACEQTGLHDCSKCGQKDCIYRKA